MATEFPDADTSPERLAEIERQLRGDTDQEEFVAYAAKKRAFAKVRGYSDDFVKFYDLLAMLHERDRMIRDADIPRSYRTVPGTNSPLYCIWGTSSITYADKLEELLRGEGI